jgi:hypothetical protein
MSEHPAKTCLADRVVYWKEGKVPLVAFVVEVHSDHCASLVYWCRQSLAWKEACSITFGKREGCYFVNPEA